MSLSGAAVAQGNDVLSLRPMYSHRANGVESGNGQEVEAVQALYGEDFVSIRSSRFRGDSDVRC